MNIEIGGKTFPTVEDVQTHVYQILKEAPVDQPITSSDAELIHELFLNHPEVEEKQGLGISYFKVGKHPVANARAFCVVRIDGTAETFSIRKCLTRWKTKTTTPPSKSKSKERSKGPAPKMQPGKKINPAQLQKRFDKVAELYSELGKEIDQIHKLLIVK